MSSTAPHPRTPVPLLDVNRGNAPLREEILAAIAEVCDSGRFLHGPPVQRFEQSVASRCDVPHAIGCASGSDALLLALMALDIGPGDAVIVPSFTFFATASAVWRLGARVVFADIDPQTFNLDPQKVAEAITPDCKAIIPVHLFGQCAAMDELLEIAHRHDLKVIEDAAQAIGARRQGRPAGSMGDIGCFSFYPTKNLGGFGDGGMLTTRDEALADRLRLLAGHGMRPRYHHHVVGVNSRLDSIQAAVLDVKIAHLDRWSESRRKNARFYSQALAKLEQAGCIQTPTVDAQCEHVWNQYGLRVLGGRRDEVRSFLGERGVGAEIYYPIPLHRQACFASLGYRADDFPETEKAAAEILNPPIFPELTEQELQTAADTLQAAMIPQAAAA